jgi:hypothetical protein
MQKLLRADYLWTLAIVLFPLSLLIIDQNFGFTSDWYNNLWMIAYQGLYFLDHLEFSPVFNTPTLVGITFPIFYGYFFYPILGCLSAFIGPHLAIRCAAVLILGLQFECIRKLIQKLTQDRTKSTVVALLICWATYPLTNLYNRSAFPEFIATSALTCAFCLWFSILLEKVPEKKYRLTFGFILFTLLTVGTHPLTGYFGLLLLGCTMFCTLFFTLIKDNQQIKPFLVIISFFGISLLLFLSPWIYALSLFKDFLHISNFLADLTFYPGIDELWIRLFPLPLDLRSVNGGINTPTSGLEAQINVPLLLLILNSLYLTLKQFGWKKTFNSKEGLAFTVSFILFLWILRISISPNDQTWLKELLKKGQIAYRLVTYTNMALFLSMIALYALPRNRGTIALPLSSIFSTFIITLAGCNVLIKLLHASVLLPEGDRLGYPRLSEKKEEFIQIPKSFYSVNDYKVTQTLKVLSQKDLNQSQKINIPVLEKFGEAGEVVFEPQGAGWIDTNIYPFPWNRIELNGNILSPQETYLGENGLAFQVFHAGRYTLRYRFIPEETWIFLRRLSFFTFGMISLSALFYRKRQLKKLTHLT